MSFYSGWTVVRQCIFIYSLHLCSVFVRSAWWETKEPNLKRTNEGWGAVLPVIDQQNPIIQYASSTYT